MKTKQIIIRFLDTYPGTVVGSHTLQIEVPKFADKVYGKYINPETVSREWRKLRDDKEFLKQNGYSILELLEQTGKEKKFTIRRINSEIRGDSGRIAQESRNNNSVDRPEETPEAKG